MFIASHIGWSAYDTFLNVSRLGQPVYNPNLLRPNPNLQKPMLGWCHVREFG